MPEPTAGKATDASVADARGVGHGRSELLHVLRGGALLALHDVELHALTLGEALKALALDARMVNEAVLLAVVTRDEAEALRVVEPLDGAGHAHCRNSCTGCRCGRSPALPHWSDRNVLVITPSRWACPNPGRNSTRDP